MNKLEWGPLEDYAHIILKHLPWYFWRRFLSDYLVNFTKSAVIRRKISTAPPSEQPWMRTTSRLYQHNIETFATVLLEK